MKILEYCFLKSRLIYILVIRQVSGFHVSARRQAG